MRPLDLPCGEQGKQLTAKAFKLAERDKFMSEQKASSFMEKLDQWSEGLAFALVEGDAEGIAGDHLEDFKKAIREKVLESYRNGRNAGPRKFEQPPKGNR